MRCAPFFHLVAKCSYTCCRQYSGA